MFIRPTSMLNLQCTLSLWMFGRPV